MYKYLAVIIVLAVGLTFPGCDTTDSGGNDLESLITNSTWFATSTENSAETYIEYDFGDSQVEIIAHTFPCDGGQSFPADTVGFEVIDDETMSIDGDEATVLDYSEDEINVEGENDDGDTVTVSFKPSCEGL